jgi:hypothetical protein
MNHRTFAASVSALILATQLGSPLLSAEPDLEQLSRIEALLTENDVAGLRDYIARNPELLEGDTEMAQLLRQFLRASDELPAYLGYRGDAVTDGAPGAEGSPLGQLAPGAGADAIY